MAIQNANDNASMLIPKSEESEDGKFGQSANLVKDGKPP